RSSAFISEGSIRTAFTSILPETRTLTRPPPEEPSTSTWPSSSCIACIFDCSSAACFIMPRKSGIDSPLEIVVGIVRRLFAETVIAGAAAGIGLRRLGGKLAHLDHLGAGKARQHLLHARVGLGGALALAFFDQALLAQGRLAR